MRVRLATGATIALLLALAAIFARGDREPASGAPTSRMTTRATFADRNGDGVLGRGPGEPLRSRTDLGSARRPGATLATLAQITDAHVRDEESPARAFVLDRLGGPFSSTFRPQEALSAQTLAATVESIDALDPDAVLETGDLVDNAQSNELTLALATLRGGRVDPDSGTRGYRGPQSATGSDPFLYRPDVDAPRHPGLLAAAQRPFHSRGLRAPWYPVPGNHDKLVQGEAAPTPALRTLATGPRVLVEPDRDIALPRNRRTFDPAVLDRLLARGLPGTTAIVPADPRRRLLSASKLAARLRRAPGSGAGGSGSRLDYAFSVGPKLRVIALDLVDRARGADASVSPAQLAWLRGQLGAAGDRWIMVMTHQPLASSTAGRRVLDELDRSPRVVAALAGDTHTNKIRPRRNTSGGYWMITTASLTDFPQQSRALRLRETPGGGVVIDTWMLDSARSRLADTARSLA
ncbi:MAG: hypothetical protein ACR2HC_09615, partial [Thermoleophilaceae bacterium]